MSFAKLHKSVAYLFAALGLFAISLGPYLSLASELLMAAAFVGSWFVEGARVREPRWVRGWTIGLVALLGVQVLRGLLGAAILPLALEFTAALQLSRLFNRRTAKEYQQIGAIALLHLIAATVLSTELSYAFAFLGFVIVAPWMLSLGHLREEIENHQGGDEAGRENAIARVLASKRLVGPGFLAATAALAVPLFLMTGFLFVVFPRVGLGFLSFGRGMGQPVSGFGANVELGDFGVIRSDATVVLRVTPPELPEEPPEQASIRMRGTSFDHYDGRRWTRSRELEPTSVGRIGTHYGVPVRLPNPTRDRAWDVVLDPLEEPVIFLPPRTVGLRIPPRISGGVEIGRDISIAPGVDIRYGDADGLGLRYTAYTANDAHARDWLREDERPRYLQLPDDHERVAELARRWTRGASDDRERVEQIVERLRDSGEFTYSLQMPAVDDDEQPLDVFLFRARRGHCEYYSTALTVMLRSLEIPARNVTGFLGGRYNGYGGYYAISQGDAHSWVEAFYGGRWHVIDPTPPARDAIAPDPGWLGGLQQMVDALRTRWTEDVVGYDLRSQIGLFRTLRRWLGREADDDEVTEDATRDPGSVAPGGGLPAWVYALAVLLLIGAVLGARWVWRRRRRGAAPVDPAVAGAIALYLLLDRSLAAIGWPRDPSQTPRERLEELERAGFEEIDLVREVTGRYVAARYGGEGLERAQIDRLRRALRAMGRRRGRAKKAG